MPANRVNVVLAHGAWADGSSWSKVIGPLKAAGMASWRLRQTYPHNPMAMRRRQAHGVAWNQADT